MMFKKVIYALAGMGLLACSNSDDPYQQTSAVLGEQVIYRAHQDLQASNQQLLSSTQAFCQGEQSLAQIRQHFLPAQPAWASLPPVLIGPLNEGNRAWQVKFWPDKKILSHAKSNSL